MPKRIQRKRTKGWRMPDGAIYVGRPTKWGNAENTGDKRKDVIIYRQTVADYWTPKQLREELGGRDLACWCPLDQPCHADVLLELANSPRLLLCDDCGSYHADNLDDVGCCPCGRMLMRMYWAPDSDENAIAPTPPIKGAGVSPLPLRCPVGRTSQIGGRIVEKPLFLPNSPVVCICGSTRFRDEIHGANRRLTMAGIAVLAPGVFGHAGDPITDEDKERLDALHLKKITLADAVLVVCPWGYIGESTEAEIAFAERWPKPVYYSTSAIINALAPNPPAPAAGDSPSGCGESLGARGTEEGE